MKLVKAHYIIEDGPKNKEEGKQILKNIEECARICYQSNHKISPYSYINLIKMIMNNGHTSVLEHEKLTVRFIVDRGVSHELVRHRIASFSQESTRYCNYSKERFDNELTFIEISESMFPSKEAHEQHLKSLEIFEKIYLQQIALGCTPQIARTVLPNSLKTEIVVTANIREWREIFKQRAINKKAHPQMREVMVPLHNHLKNLIPYVFDYE